MSGWCPGTGAVGLASGKIDALVFLLGAVGGSMLYNELYPILGPIFAGDRGVVFAYDSLGVSEASFAFFFTVIAVGCFWGAESIEKKRRGKAQLWGSPFLKAFSAILIVGAFGLFAVAGPRSVTGQASLVSPVSTTANETGLLEGLQTGSDHMGSRELADRLLAGDKSIKLVDIRTPKEFGQFHIRSAVNIPVEDLPGALVPYKHQGLIVLYSNGMTHPAQARDSLFRMGFDNVYFLTDGLEGFLNTCLKPASLRAAPVSPEMTSKINAWRAFFLAPEMPAGDLATGAGGMTTVFSENP